MAYKWEPLGMKRSAAPGVGESLASIVKATPLTPSGTQKHYCRVPFGGGYRAISFASRQQLVSSDLWSLEGSRAAKHFGRGCADLSRAFEVARTSGGGLIRLGTTSPLVAALSILWGNRLRQVVLFEAIAGVLQVLAVLCLGAIFHDIEMGNAATVDWLLALLGDGLARQPLVRVLPLLAISLISQLVQQFMQHKQVRVAAEAVTALQAWLFRSVVASSQPQLPELPKMLSSFPSFAEAWVYRSKKLAFLHLLIASCATLTLLRSLGIAGVLAPALVCSLLAVEMLLRRKSKGSWGLQVQKLRSRRNTLLKEMLDAAPAMKMFAWERLFFRRLDAIREEERSALNRESRAAVLAGALHPELLLVIPGFACLCISVYLRGAADRYSNPDGLRMWQAFEALVACSIIGDRLRRCRDVYEYLMPSTLARPFEELHARLRPRRRPPQQDEGTASKKNKYAITVEGMRFYWPDGEDGSGPKPVSGPAPVKEPEEDVEPPAPGHTEAFSMKAEGLHSIDSLTDDASVAERARRAQQGVFKFDLKVLLFQVKRGALAALVGATSCGKSTLFSGLVGTCAHENWGDDGEGTGVVLGGRLAYVPQTPSLLSSCTVRENVLFGHPFDRVRYEQALATSSLVEDVSLMPGGDMIDVSEITSNGVRMRVQLARALYSDAEIVLLDDPFESMEKDRASRVLASIKKKLQKERTILLATQNLSLLDDFETIIVIRNGTIFEQGDYNTLAGMPTEFARMLLIANKKDADRARQRDRLANGGMPCTFISYEVGPDPMEEVFPLDREYEAGGRSVAQDNRWHTLDTKESQGKWTSANMSKNKEGRRVRKEAHNIWDSNWSNQHAGGVKVRGDEYIAYGGHESEAKVPGSTMDNRGKPRSNRERMGGHKDKRGAVFDASHAKQIQEFFKDGPIADFDDRFASHDLAKANFLQPFVADEKPSKVKDKREKPGGTSGLFTKPQSRRENAMPLAEAVDDASVSGIGAADVDDLFARARPQATELEDGEDFFAQAKPRQQQNAHEDLEDGEFEEGELESDSQAPQPAGYGYEGLLTPQAPASSPYGRFGALPPPPPPPPQQGVATSSGREFGGFPQPFPQQFMSPQYDEFAPMGGAMAQPYNEFAPMAPVPLDYEANMGVSPYYYEDGMHSAPPPNKEGGTSSSSSKGRGDDPRLKRLDVLEQALKEKNKKIAELERQIGHAQTQPDSVEDKGSAILGAKVNLLVPDSDATGLQVAMVDQRGRSGTGLLWMLRGGGMHTLFLVLVFIFSTGFHLGAYLALGYMLADRHADPIPAGTTTAAPTSPPATTQALPGVPSPAPTTTTTTYGGIIFVGFNTTTGGAQFTFPPSGSPVTTRSPVIVLKSWKPVQSRRYCREMGLSEFTAPGDTGYVLDTSVGWHLEAKVELSGCKERCEELINWGCRFVSWGGPLAAQRFCYLHRTCLDLRELSVYEMHELNVTVATEPTRRRLIKDFLASGDPSDSLRPLVLLSCFFLVISTCLQSKLAVSTALIAGQAASLRQLKAVLSAPIAIFDQSRTLWLRERLSDDVVDVDTALPTHFCRLCLPCVHLFGAIISFLFIGGAQIFMILTILAVAVALATYLHVMRLPLIRQLWQLSKEAEDASVQRIRHLAENHEILHVHDRINNLSDEFEALCYNVGQSSITQDAAQRWVSTRVYWISMIMLAVLAFVLLQDEDGAIVVGLKNSTIVPGAVALLQVALLPEAAMLLMRHGAAVSRGTIALKRMRQVWNAGLAEELESPLLHMRVPSKRERKDLQQSYASLRSRVVLGDKVIERDGDAEQAMRLYDLAALERQQNISCTGFPLEKIADDWPYFGAVEMKDVTMRYFQGATPALQSVALTMIKNSSVLLVGPEHSGKTSLISTLLRLWPCEAGSLILDAVDVRSVGICVIRSRIAFVPEVTVLFNGTWRSNLDPLGEFEEDQLVLALRLTRLWHWLLQHAPKGLDESMPQGEALNPALKALLGLTRAFLRLLQKRSKLLLMDRVTCKLDAFSDADLTALVLRFCRRREAAVLQASRRVLQSPLYDTVAVMRLGRVVEQGVPRRLWAKDGGFREYARSLGVDSSKLSRPEEVARRLTSMWNWEVSPQEEPEWEDEFVVSMKKQKAEKGSKSGSK